MRTFLIILLLLVPLSFSAVLEGSVYDPGLEPLSKCVLTINTTPMQRIVLSNSTYSINLTEGDYVVNVTCFDGREYLYDSENISVPADGTYHLDFIALPDLSPPADFGDIDMNITYSAKNEGQDNSVYWLGGGILVLALALILYWVIYKKPREEKAGLRDEELMKSQDRELSEDLKLIITALKDNDGRATQKELRQLLHWSEAKMSLALAELESYGIVKRIKKGRGNIVVLIRNSE